VEGKYIESVKTIIEQEGDCSNPIYVNCDYCPFHGRNCKKKEDVLKWAIKYLAGKENKKEMKMPIDFDMNEDTFVVVVWPDVQEYQDMDGFDDNSVLINDETLLGEYGGSAYMVRCNWLHGKQKELEK